MKVPAILECIICLDTDRPCDRRSRYSDISLNTSAHNFDQTTSLGILQEWTNSIA